MKEKLKKIKKERVSFFADFKAFINRGNVLDLAVGVAIGAAFGAITSGLVKYIINPVIALLTDGVSLDAWKTGIGQPLIDEATGAVLRDELTGRIVYENYIQWGAWIQTIIDFLIIAFSIFLAVRIIRRANRRIMAKKIAAEEAAAAEKKAAEEAKAAAEEAKQKAEAEAKKAIEEEFYANIREQSRLLREINEKMNRK